jgi:predicted oxidoreductase
MTDTTTMEQFWEKRYNETDKERADYVMLAARMTGYFGGIAKFDSTVPKHVKIRMLQGLIDMWNDIDSGLQLHQEWVAGWKKEIEELKK